MTNITRLAFHNEGAKQRPQCGSHNNHKAIKLPKSVCESCSHLREWVLEFARGDQRARAIYKFHLVSKYSRRQLFKEQIPLSNR